MGEDDGLAGVESLPGGGLEAGVPDMDGQVLLERSCMRKYSVAKWIVVYDGVVIPCRRDLAIEDKTSGCVALHVEASG